MDKEILLAPESLDLRIISEITFPVQVVMIINLVLKTSTKLETLLHLENTKLEIK